MSQPETRRAAWVRRVHISGEDCGALEVTRECALSRAPIVLGQKYSPRWFSRRQGNATSRSGTSTFKKIIRLVRAVGMLSIRLPRSKAIRTCYYTSSKPVSGRILLTRHCRCKKWMYSVPRNLGTPPMAPLAYKHSSGQSHRRTFCTQPQFCHNHVGRQRFHQGTRWRP